MTEDDWEATDQGRAVNSFMKYTLSLAMVHMGSITGNIATSLFRKATRSVLDNPEFWRRLGAKEENLDNIREDARYLRMLEQSTDSTLYRCTGSRARAALVRCTCRSTRRCLLHWSRRLLTTDSSESDCLAILDATSLSSGAFVCSTVGDFVDKLVLTAAVGAAGALTVIAVGVAPSAGAAPFSSCDQARAAGAAPIYAGQPGYSRKLDRDGDGIACDQGGGGYVPVPVPLAPAPDTATPIPTPVPSAMPAPAPAGAAGEVCYDWMKLRLDPVTGEQQVCGANTSPAVVFYWTAAHPMPGGVHDAGSLCSDIPLFTFARSTDDYMIWCAEGTSVYLPGGRSVANPPQPIWGLYSP